MNGFDVYRQWLGIPPDRRPPSHYELLGLDACEQDAARIRTASLDRTAAVRRYCLGQHGAEATRLLGEIAAAFACLSDPAAKAAYDRQLAGADGDSSSADHPPPVQRQIASAAIEASDGNANAGGRKTSAAVRSSFGIGRRRAASSAAPARFSLAVCLLLAAACGALWSARFSPYAEAHRASVAGPESLSSALDVRPLRRAPLDATQKSSTSKPTGSLAPDEAPSTLGVENGATENDDDPAKVAEINGPAEAPPPDEIQVKPAAADADMKAAAPAVGGESPEEPDRRPQPTAESEETRAKRADATTTTAPPTPVERAAAPPLALPPGILRKANAPPFSVAQVTGKEDVPYRQDPGRAWRSRRRGKPEVLELTFEPPVRPEFLCVFYSGLPAKIDKVVLYPSSGKPEDVPPKKFDMGDYSPQAPIWSLGSNRPPTERIRITFQPSSDGFVEVDAVKLRDQEGRPYYPVAARATSSAADEDPDLLDVEQDSAAGANESAASDDKPNDEESSGNKSSSSESSGSLDKVDEVFAEAQLDEARNRQTVAAYAALLKDHPNTAAAVEAVRDLAEIISIAPPSEAYSARRAIERLVTRHPESDAAKEVLGALGEASRRGPRPALPANRRPPPGLPSKRGG